MDENKKNKDTPSTVRPRHGSSQNEGAELPQQKSPGHARLDNTQMLEIVSDDTKFMNLIREYNRLGVELIRSEDFERALAHLQDAEKILEYAASCGKTIERYLIAATLHNEACAYQKLWELEKSSDYMEAILYNISAFLEQTPSVEMCNSLRDKTSSEYRNFGSYLHQRLNAVAYHLQYSAVSSQIGKHAVAISSTRKALTLMEEILTEAYSYQCFIKGKVSKKSEFRVLRDECKGIDRNRIPSLISECKRHFHRLQAQTEAESPDIQKVKRFSISEVMQIEPITANKAQQTLSADLLLSRPGFYQMAFFVSIAYYAIATELRLMNSSSTDIRKKSLDMERSKIYHLNAIRIGVAYVPCISEYINHIHKSLRNNFIIDLAEGSYGNDFDDQVESNGLIVSDEILENESLFRIPFGEDVGEIEREQPDAEELAPVKSQSKFQFQCQSDIVPLNMTASKKKYQSESNILQKTQNDRQGAEQKKKKSKSRSNSGGKKMMKNISSSAKVRTKNSAISSPERRKKNGNKMLVLPNQISQKKLEDEYEKSRKIIELLPGQERHKNGSSGEKTKDQSKKPEEKKAKTKKKVQDEYHMSGNPNRDRKKNPAGKEKDKKSISGKKPFKSNSKDKQLFKNKGLSQIS